MLLLALFGFLPVDADTSPPADVRHLDREASLQMRLGARPDWAAMQARWGGRWAAVWDERNRSPRFLYAPGPPLRQADALVADVAALAGVDEAGLRLDHVQAHGDRELRRYGRTWHGVPVEGDEVGIVAVADRILGVWVRLTPIHGLPDLPRPGERVIALPGRGVPALVTRVDRPERVSYTDRDGVAVVAYDPRHFATLNVSAEERTVGDALVDVPARHLSLTDSSGATAETDDLGYHGLSGSLSVRFDGTSLAVTDAGAPVDVTAEADDTLVADVDVPYAVADVQHHFYVVWDWLEARWPTHDWLGDRVPADVRVNGSCNAYYSGGTINFYRETPGYCNDLGRVSDVVYHETGHGIHDYILAMGTFAGDVSEGSADFVSATIWDDPVVGVDAWGEGTYVRELDTDHFYPTDVTGEVHNDGLIWGSFLWNLREQWIKGYGFDLGVEMTDLLFLGSLEQGPSLTDLYEAVLVADDDNGDWSDGTPHACELKDLLDYHGLGPGPIGVVSFSHTPLGPQSSWAPSYPVSFDLYDLTPDCSGLDPSTVQLWYTIGDNPVPGTVLPSGGDTGDTGDTAPTDSGDTGAPPVVADWSAWTSLPLTQSGVSWSGEIPRQLAGTQVRYFMQATSTDGTQTLSTHTGDDSLAYSFWVGDRHTIWCEDFETGAPDFTHGVGTVGNPEPVSRWTDEWVVGTPVTGGDWDPTAPVSGSFVMTTALDADYAPNNHQWLQGPVVDVSTHGPMLLVSQQRWLTVEDGLYDEARWLVNGAEVWRNAATAAGGTAHLDLGWVTQDLAAEDLVSTDGTLQLAWTLGSDQGLEFGGWGLDDVCVYDLDDVPGHYRVRDLVASDDAAPVRVSWTQPWIAPLAETVLVRRRDGWPTGPTDGTVLDHDTAPTPGAAREVVDPEILEGETAYYAVFAAPTAESFYLDVLEAENADVGGVPRPPPPDTGDDTGVPDTADSSPVTDPGTTDSTPAETPDPKPAEAPAGCGCASPGAGTPLAWGMLGLGLLALRRRA